MAKSTKSGLGRGLNSLLSGSMEEAAPTEAASSEAPKKEREVVSFEEETPELKKEAKPTAAKKPLGKEEGSNSASSGKSSGEKVAEKKADQPAVPKKKIDPYLDEDDHVVIKEVKEREIKTVPQVKEETKVAKEENTLNADNEVPLESVQPNPDQPRTNFKQEEIEELAASINKDGLLQPILVRPVGKGYQIIAGERRWQACKSLGLKTVPVRIREADDGEVLELALIENIQRSDLNPIEEAYGYRRLMDRKGLTQSAVAEAVSKGRSTVANALRLLELPEDAQQLLFEEKITAGHARAILAIPTKEGREKLTARMVKEKISVREAETIARLLAGSQNKENTSTRVPTPKSFKTVARALRDSLQTNVRVKTVQGKNKIEIEFKDEEELERLFDMISASEKNE